MDTTRKKRAAIPPLPEEWMLLTFAVIAEEDSQCLRTIWSVILPIKIRMGFCQLTLISMRNRYPSWYANSISSFDPALCVAISYQSQARSSVLFHTNK